MWQWRQRLGNFGGWIDAKGRVSWGRKSPSGSRGENPIGGLVDEPPKPILILKMDVKLIFYEGKIENAYTSRCFYNACCSLDDCPVNHPHWGDGNIAIFHRKFVGMYPSIPHG